MDPAWGLHSGTTALARCRRAWQSWLTVLSNSKIAHPFSISFLLAKVGRGWILHLKQPVPEVGSASTLVPHYRPSWVGALMARVFSWLMVINPGFHSLVVLRPWTEESSHLPFLIHYYNPVRLVLRIEWGK